MRRASRHTRSAEVLTSDGVSLRVRCALRIVVTDAAGLHREGVDPVAAAFTWRPRSRCAENAARTGAEDVMRRSARIRPRCHPRRGAGAVPRAVSDVLDAYVKDVIVPAEIRTAAGDW